MPIYVVRFQQRITCNLYFYQYVKELFSVFPASLQGQAHWPGWVPDNRQFWFDFRWGLRLCRSINDIGDGADGLHSFYQFQILGISFSPPIFIHSLILFQLPILLFQFLYSLFKKFSLWFFNSSMINLFMIDLIDYFVTYPIARFPKGLLYRLERDKFFLGK